MLRRAKTKDRHAIESRKNEESNLSICSAECDSNSFSVRSIDVELCLCAGAEISFAVHDRSRREERCCSSCRDQVAPAGGFSRRMAVSSSDRNIDLSRRRCSRSDAVPEGGQVLKIRHRDGVRDTELTSARNKWKISR